MSCFLKGHAVAVPAACCAVPLCAIGRCSSWQAATMLIAAVRPDGEQGGLPHGDSLL